MTTTSIYLLTVCCTIFFVSTYALQDCSSQLGSHEDEYSYGPCRVKIEQKANQHSNGQSVLVNISLSSSSECRNKRPEVPGYVYLPGYCNYKYHSTPKTWIEGWDVCKREGGHLAVFNSEEEAKFVGNIPTNQYDWAFIGFHDLYQEGNYVTIFDQTLVEAGWSKWQISNPNGKTGENCGVTFRSGELGDFVCSSPRTFFCEICYNTF